MQKLNFSNFSKKIHIFHSWEPICKEHKEDFMEEIIRKNIPSDFRKCMICNKYQERNYDGIGLGWSELDQEKINILIKKIKRIDGILVILPKTDWKKGQSNE